MSISSKHVRDGGDGFVVVDDRFSTSDVLIFVLMVRAQSFVMRMTLRINCNRRTAWNDGIWQFAVWRVHCVFDHI